MYLPVCPVFLYPCLDDNDFQSWPSKKGYKIALKQDICQSLTYAYNLIYLGIISVKIRDMPQPSTAYPLLLTGIKLSGE
jgi:hypothetical protein